MIDATAPMQKYTSHVVQWMLRMKLTSMNHTATRQYAGRKSPVRMCVSVCMRGFVAASPAVHIPMTVREVASPACLGLNVIELSRLRHDSACT